MRKFMFLKDTCLCCLDEGTRRGDPVWTLTLGRVKINLCDYHARFLKKSTLRTDFGNGKVCISLPAQGKWIKCRLPFIRKCSVCGHRVLLKTMFCSSCGSDMEG